MQVVIAEVSINSLEHITTETRKDLLKASHKVTIPHQRMWNSGKPGKDQREFFLASYSLSDVLLHYCIVDGTFRPK